MENLDHRLSHGFADVMQKTALRQKVATLCASSLVWFLGGMYVMLISIVHERVSIWGTLILLLPVGVAWTTTLVLEYLFRRRRPFQEQGSVLGVGMLWVPPSFPSGHATIAFSLAWMISNFSSSGAWTVAAYTMAVLISLGRVAVRVHYVTDVLAGAVVGTLVTSVFLSSLL